MIREMRSPFLLFVYHIWTVIFHQMIHLYASIGSQILRLIRTTSDRNTFVTLSNRLLKGMQK